MSDPFTMAGERIKAVVLARREVVDVVAEGCRFNPSSRVPKTQVVASALTLEQRDFELTPHGPNSMTCSGFHEYGLVIRTESKLTTTLLNALKWEVFMALASAPSDLGLPFVRTWTLLPGVDEPEDEGQKFRQWQTALAVRVEMFWSKRVSGAQNA